MGDPRGPIREQAPHEVIEQLIIHPVLDRAYVAAEHPEGDLGWLGDALGSDFMVVRFDGRFAKLFEGEGNRNEDWYGWKANVLAPFDGVVTHVVEPVGINEPGGHEGGPTGGMIFRREDGVFVAYGHVDDFEVEEGERVEAGQLVARMSNNGTSWAPHLHVGAWKGETPLQICIDLSELGRMVREIGEEVYSGSTRKDTAQRA